jgi:hypothetical protein
MYITSFSYENLLSLAKKRPLKICAEFFFEEAETSCLDPTHRKKSSQGLNLDHTVLLVTYFIREV